ncbi:hypothetical protein KBD33_00415 [Candidatus Gracilibacteria bacterium]|nr:hypothetical protein [Candidatus Gracilibacteria bacterium]
MSKITRLRKVSWKSKNNVYGLLLQGNNGKIEEDYLFQNFDKFHIDILIIPTDPSISIDLNNSYLSNIEIIKAGILGKDITQNGILVDAKIADEIAQDILKIDVLEVGLYSGASAKIAIDRGEKYEWKNIGILLYK